MSFFSRELRSEPSFLGALLKPVYLRVLRLEDFPREYTLFPKLNFEPFIFALYVTFNTDKTGIKTEILYRYRIYPVK